MSSRLYNTPGVYVEEHNAFPNSVMGVETAMPLFVGYTETANVSGVSVLNKAQKITSLAEFTAIYGDIARPDYTVQAANPSDFDLQAPDASGALHYYNVVQIGPVVPILATSMRLFFENGGEECYVVSVGDDAQAAQGIDVDLLMGGLDIAATVEGVTLLAVPDAVLLDTGEAFETLVQAMLAQCNRLQDRMAILDVYGTETINPDSPEMPQDVYALLTAFRKQLGPEGLMYGASYFPFLHSTCVTQNDVTYQMFENAALRDLLSGQAGALFDGAQLASVTDMITRTADKTLTAREVVTLDQNLSAALPALPQLEGIVAARMGTLPPSAAMAGVYTMVDQSRGAWKAPANIGLITVRRPTLAITEAMQGDMNVPRDGKTVNAIRDFPGQGTIVWGARTLDGNSNDWRYITVRRTMIYIEQSLKAALQDFVFAPNDSNTWKTAIAMASSFLTGLWQQGGLVGSHHKDAFNVQCGIGSTMTAQDILEGNMNVQISVAPIRPAEFIVLNFKQKMANS